MSNQDDQLNDEFKRTLDDLDIPPPSEAAKQSAIAMAMQEFDAAQREARQEKPGI